VDHSNYIHPLKQSKEMAGGVSLDHNEICNSAWKT